MQFNIKAKYDYLVPAALLSAASGCLNSYTYLEHDKVFAGLQTGNLILLGTHLGQGQGQGETTTRYIISIMMFMVGIIIVRFIQHHYPSDANLSRSTLVIFYEVLLIGISGLLYEHISNIVTTGFLSMVAAGQFQEFKHLNGASFNSGMMTGNLRTTVEGLYDVSFKHDRKAGIKGITTFTLIISFVFGAASTGFMVSYLGENTIWISAIILLITWLSSHLYYIKPSSH